MVGRQVNELYARRASAESGDVVLRVEGLTRRGNAQDPHATVLDHVDLEARRGRFSGSPVSSARAARRWRGRSSAPTPSTAAASWSMPPRSESALRRTPSVTASGSCPRTASSRRSSCRSPCGPISAWRCSTASPWRVFVDEKAELALVNEFRRALNIRMTSAEQSVANLSGGNQQKVVLARWLAVRPKVLIVDEPTRGIDVGAKVEVHNLLFEMAQSGIRDRRHILGAAGGAGDQRPHRDASGRTGDRRDRSRGGEPGKAHGHDDAEREGGMTEGGHGRRPPGADRRSAQGSM